MKHDPNVPDPTKPWCPKCESHTPTRLVVGVDGGRVNVDIRGNDTEGISIALFDKFPDTNPIEVRSRLLQSYQEIQRIQI